MPSFMDRQFWGFDHNALRSKLLDDAFEFDGGTNFRGPQARLIQLPDRDAGDIRQNGQVPVGLLDKPGGSGLKCRADEVPALARAACQGRFHGKSLGGSRDP